MDIGERQDVSGRNQREAENNFVDSARRTKELSDMYEVSCIMLTDSMVSDEVAKLIKMYVSEKAQKSCGAGCCG
jgi:hypothetical protein